MTRHRVTLLFAAVALTAALIGRSSADPLPDEILKFQQLPLNNGNNNGVYPNFGQSAPFPGHDEWSTAVLQSPGVYVGPAMVDDFADNVTSDIVHVEWWGSYQNNAPGSGVQQFMIAFENDQPQDANNPFSHPTFPGVGQLVNRGALTPGSGTFTETALPVADWNGSPDGVLYHYNAELSLPFHENAGQVYWLKIVALTNPTDTFTWGWHDRDYGMTNNLFAPVLPGERDISGGNLPGPVWHFQDDALSAAVTVNLNNGTFQQTNYQPQVYNTYDGYAAGLSKDLAFGLYYVPEPSSFVLGALGILGLLVARRKRSA